MSFLQDYEPVEDRLREFWHDHPYGRVITTLEHHGDGDYIVRAEIYYGSETREGLPIATGYAHDSASQLPANMKSSALEVCETSAIGRALANAGYAPKGKRPSREEMTKALPVGENTQGEGVTQPTGSTTLLDIASDEQWERLVSVAGGNTVRAVNRLNKVNATNYTKATAREGATSEEVANAITGEGQ